MAALTPTKNSAFQKNCKFGGKGAMWKSWDVNGVVEGYSILSNVNELINSALFFHSAAGLYLKPTKL